MRSTRPWLSGVLSLRTLSRLVAVWYKTFPDLSFISAPSSTSVPFGVRMMSKALSLFALAFATVGVGAVPAPTSPCAPVHIIAARGSNEAPGPGSFGAIVTGVQNQSKQQVSTSSVSYVATLTNYASSSANGTAALTLQLTAQVNQCPGQKIVLIGYSQVGSTSRCRFECY